MDTKHHQTWPKLRTWWVKASSSFQKPSGGDFHFIWFFMCRLQRARLHRNNFRCLPANMNWKQLSSPCPSSFFFLPTSRLIGLPGFVHLAMRRGHWKHLFSPSERTGRIRPVVLCMAMTSVLASVFLTDGKPSWPSPVHFTQEKCAPNTYLILKSTKGD